MIKETTLSITDDAQEPVAGPNLSGQHYSINYGDTGYTYDTILGPYLSGARSVRIEDPYIRMPHQIANFVRFCETVVKSPTVREIHLMTGYDDQTDLTTLNEKIDELKQSLLEIECCSESGFKTRISMIGKSE